MTNPLGIPIGVHYISQRAFDEIGTAFCDREAQPAAVKINNIDGSVGIHAADPTAADRFLDLVVEFTGVRRENIDRNRTTTAPDHRGARMYIFPSLRVRTTDH